MIAASTLLGMALNFIGINPIRALVWSAMINGCLAPVLLCLIMLISNEPAVMGKRVNGTAMNWLGWITTGVMTAAVIGLIATTVYLHSKAGSSAAALIW
jgi:Mn2+/Fe2+ NRAMP family transporter